MRKPSSSAGAYGLNQTFLNAFAHRGGGSKQFSGSLATFFTGMSYIVFHLILLRSVSVGGGEAFYAPSANALLSEYHTKTRARAMSIHQTSLYIGIILSGVIGGFIAENYA